MTFGSKQLHGLLLNAQLPAAGPHVTDMLMAAYLLDAHLDSFMHLVAQRHGLQPLAELVRGIIDASPLAQQQRSSREFADAATGMTSWAIPSFPATLAQTSDPAAPPKRSGSRSKTVLPAIAAPTTPPDATEVTALDRVKSYFQTVSDQARKVEESARRAVVKVQERVDLSAHVKELTVQAAHAAQITRATYEEEAAVAAWRLAESGAVDAATTTASKRHKKNLLSVGYTANQLAQRKVVVTENKVARYARTLGAWQERLVAAEAAVVAWGKRVEGRKVRGVELETLAVCAAEAVQMQLMHGPMQVWGREIVFECCPVCV